MPVDRATAAAAGAGSEIRRAASRVALREVERKISDLLGARQYQQMRRNLADIAELDL